MTMENKPKPGGSEMPEENQEFNIATEPETFPESSLGQAATGPEGRITALEAELADAKDRMLRALAEIENTRTRARREREDAGKYAISAFARDLLTVSDNLRRALDATPAELKSAPLIQGVEATERELLKVFEKNGIRKIDPSGQAFDPNFHEVMFEAPLPGKPPGTILQVLEPGYVIGERLLRPARVGVAKNEENAAASSHSVDTSA